MARNLKHRVARLILTRIGNWLFNNPAEVVDDQKKVEAARERSEKISDWSEVTERDDWRSES